MPSTPEVADAVAVHLNAGTFSVPVQARRAWLPVYDLGEMDALRVTVVPRERILSLQARGIIQAEHRIEVAVQQRVDPDDLGAVDRLVNLCAAIVGWCSAAVLAALPSATWTRTEHTLLAAPDHLQEYRQFTGLLTLTYRTWEAP